MRGGAIAPFAWALLLTVLGAINWIWTGDTIQIASFGFAAVVVAAVGAALVIASPDAIRRGAPEAHRKIETVPALSAAAVIAALGVASIVIGVAFGHFPIYLGAGLLVAALGRLLVELRSQRRTTRAWRDRCS